jgi:uncharacterized protein (DUF305 family)
MKNKSNIAIVTVAAIVAIAGISVYAFNRNDGEMMDDNTSMMSGDKASQSTVSANKDSSDYKMFADVTGEDYDRSFLANMIAHHQGAVDMANLALTSAKHQEVKDLATAIISAQTKEIGDMTAWQKSWNYPASSGEAMMDHSSMGMMDANAGMMKDLNGKTGDEFDKAFLSQMIMHHQSAIDMASSGTTNAYHQEVKDLTKGIITAQTKEILQMRQWQKDWNYSS